MSAPVIPVTLENTFALGDGSTADGFPVARALQLNQDQVSNVYTISGGQLKFSFQEHGVAYDETEATNYRSEVSLPVPAEQPTDFSMKVDQTPVQMWGINFAGRVLVNHGGGKERVIYIPGTRTYDPAGLTGDAHASERIGPSCSRTQLAITVAELVASLRGAELDQINTMHEKTCPLIRRYHGRMVMSDWMKLQIEEAVYKGTDVTPYPEYIKGLVRDSKFELSNARQHTREYLELYNGGTARPPIHYYRKVAKKDKVEDLLTGKDLAAFKKMME